MTEEQYYQIIGACDKLLLRSDATLEWIAIPSLHILTEHPIHLTMYQDLVRGPSFSGGHKGGLFSFSNMVQRGYTLAHRVAPRVRNIIRAKACATWRNALMKAKGAKSHGSLDSVKVDAIIVSWLVNLDHLQQMNDFYFGNLQSLLADRGLSSLLVLRNQTGHPINGPLEGTRRDGPCMRLILPDITNLCAELGFIRRYLRVRRQLRRARAAASSFFESEVCRKARDLILSNAVVANLRLHAQIAELCHRLQPSMIMTLYEGHAWERCVWHAAQTSSLPILCVGYQHTILRKHSHAVKRSLGSHRRYDPDLILTVGEVTRRILEASKALRNVRILTLGTHRRASGAALVDTPRSVPTFLVLPEGIEPECIHLFEFALECARRLPDTRFIFRAHPVLPFERLESKLKGYHPVPSNVEVSRDRSIEDDFTRAAYLLYRGSSTVIYAILAGLKPFYIARPNEMDIDPLYELSEWREYVHSVDDLIPRYRSHRAQAGKNSIAEWQRARDYCDGYVQPIREDAIDEMIELAGEISKNSGVQGSGIDSRSP